MIGTDSADNNGQDRLLANLIISIVAIISLSIIIITYPSSSPISTVSLTIITGIVGYWVPSPTYLKKKPTPKPTEKTVYGLGNEVQEITMITTKSSCCGIWKTIIKQTNTKENNHDKGTVTEEINTTWFHENRECLTFFIQILISLTLIGFPIGMIVRDPSTANVQLYLPFISPAITYWFHSPVQTNHD